jgi:hypothetical protein
MYDVWWLGSISGAVYVFIYFDMFYIQNGIVYPRRRYGIKYIWMNINMKYNKD